MKAKLHLYELLREDFKKPVMMYRSTYLNKIKPIFENINEESKKIEHNKLEELNTYFNSDVHNSSEFSEQVADQAYEEGLEYVEHMALMEYSTRLMWISTLYHS